MQWYIIENEAEFQQAKARFEEIYQVGKDSPDYREMELLAWLIAAYEKKHYDLPKEWSVEE